MALKFLGIWPDTPDDGSPTIWLDDTTGDLVIQSWKADEETIRQAQEVGSVPGHSKEVPEHESVIRLPANMLQFIPRPENLEMAAVEVSDKDDDSRDGDGGNSGT